MRCRKFLSESEVEPIDSCRLCLIYIKQAVDFVGLCDVSAIFCLFNDCCCSPILAQSSRIFASHLLRGSRRLLSVNLQSAFVQVRRGIYGDRSSH